MAEKVEILELETGNSEQTLKDLKDLIKELRKELDNCAIGSDEFKETLNELSIAQDKLKQATKGNTDANEALDGSYDSLVKKMAALRKEWKSTTDTVKRSELGKEIAEINQQLKDMDAEIGNFQRNVGDYGSAFDGLTAKVEGNTIEFERMNTAAQDVIGSFDVIEGGLKAIGVESEFVNGMMDKLSGAMKMTQGFKSVKEGAGTFKQLSTAAGGATTAVGGLSVGLIAVVGAFAAVVAGAIALAGNMDKLKNKFRDVSAEEKARTAAAELNEQLTEISSQTEADKITRLKELSRAYKQIGDDMHSKQSFVEEYKDELEGMGIAMSDVNTADIVFIKNTNAYIKAISARAKADALREKAKEDYANYLKEIAKLEKELTEAQNKAAAGTPDKSFWENLGEAFINASYYEGVPVDQIQDLNEGWTDEIAQRNIDAVQSKIDAATVAIEASMEELFAKAAEFDKEADALLAKPAGGGSPTGGPSGGKSQAQREAEERAKMIAAIQKRLYENTLSLREKELSDLKTKFDEEMALLGNNEEAKLALTEEYNTKVAAINKKYNDAAAAATKAVLEKKQQELLADLDKKILGIENRLAEVSTDVMIEYDANAVALEEDQMAEAIQNEIDRTLELQRVRDAAYDAHLAQLKETMANGLLSAEQQEALAAEYVMLEKQKAQAVADTNNQVAALNKQLIEQQKADNQQLASNITNTFTGALNAVSNILAAVQSNIDTNNKEGFEKSKKLQIANATISMLVGITNAISGLFTTKTGPWDIALAAIQAAAIATSGSIQIAQISKQTYNSSGAASKPSVSMPSINTAALMSTPVSYTTEVKGAQTEEMIPQKVYVVESDITSTQNKVKTVEEESTF